MLKYSVLFIVLLLSDLSFGQSKININGVVLNSETDEPISYATIGIPNRNVGTISKMSVPFQTHLVYLIFTFQKTTRTTLYISLLSATKQYNYLSPRF